MRILIAPDKFKGCLSAAQVASTIERGVRLADSSAEVSLCPMADGGEGTVAALVAATGGRFVRARVTGPVATQEVDAQYGILGDGETAVIEMAAASGMALLPHKSGPLFNTTYGTGELILHAADRGARKIILGIGGSATNDAGIGALQALGCRIEFSEPPMEEKISALVMRHIVRIDPPDRPLPEILIACDVDNPLYGERGSAKVFSRQKGADDSEIELLDLLLREFVARTGTEKLAQMPGAGAAGGLGFGLCAFLRGNVRMAPGFDLVADACDLAGRLKNADLCITGEGRFDASSLYGKTAVGVARRCAQGGVRCVVLAGGAEADAEEKLHLEAGAAVVPIADGPITLQESMKRTSELLARAACRVVRLSRL